jgi:hypothetical protein
MPNITGIYDEHDACIGHIHSNKLCNNLLQLLDKNKKIIDFGCGIGSYVDALIKEDFDAVGIDGINPHNNPNIKIADLSNDINLGYKGQVISLEVGEHIPEQYESIFLDNITKHCNDLMIISWAVEGQAGIGHVNCKSNEYIMNQITKRGFIYDANLTTLLRENVEDHCDYFRNTIMVFKKYE